MITVAARESKSRPQRPSLPSVMPSPSASPVLSESSVAREPAVSPRTFTPEQAGAWIVKTAQNYGGVNASEVQLQLLFSELESIAQEWSPAHLQAVGRALGDVFKPAAGRAGLSQELGYGGLERLMRESFLQADPQLSPVQTGALFCGLRRCLRADLPGANVPFLRIISRAVQANVPLDHRVAMACGFYQATQATPRAAYRPDKLAIHVPLSHRAAVQDTLNWGKRLAVDGMSFFRRGVQAPEGKRALWVMMAYRMLGDSTKLPSAVELRLTRSMAGMTPASAERKGK